MLILAVSIVSTVEDHLEDISVETALVDVEISFNTEEGKFSFSKHLLGCECLEFKYNKVSTLL